MLLQFVVENFLSFHGPALLSALPAPEIEHRPEQLLKTPDGREVLRVLAIYGANASGKSNLIKALRLVRQLVVEGTHPNHPIPTTPFKLDAESARQPSRFEVDFIAAGEAWSYSLEVTPQRVEAERLLLRRGEDEELVFERVASDNADAPPAFSFGPRLALEGERGQRIRFVAEGTCTTDLFLFEAAGRHVAEVAEVARWFRSDFGALTADFMIEEELLLKGLKREEHLAPFVTQLLHDAGTGVRGLGAVFGSRRGVAVDWEAAEQKVRRAQVDGLDLEELRKLGVETRLGLSHSADAQPFTLDEESDGTVRLLQLSPFIFELLSSPRPLVRCVDELDRSLHPNLSRFVLETVLAAPPERGGQLIFTTHDTNLLDLNLLPRDAVWFVEKDAAGASSLHALSDFLPEQLEALGGHLERGYLVGRFGAVPVLGDPRRLGREKP